MAKNIRIAFTGRRLTTTDRPLLLQTLARGLTGAVDPFLPADYLEVVSAHDLSLSTRSSGEAVPCAVSAAPDTVVLLELADGTTVVTSGARLQQTLTRVDGQSTASNIASLSRLQSAAITRRGLSGETAGDLIQRVFTVVAGRRVDPIIADARRELSRLTRRRTGKAFAARPHFGGSWLGTKALMWAIERRLAQPPGLYRWSPAAGQAGVLTEVDDATLAADADQGPLLIFIHGTASSTQGSFGDLAGNGGDDWPALAAHFGGRLYGFEHRTLSESPIRNAIDLLRRLPMGARVNLVTHSRGGIVGDLLCLDDLDRSLIDGYRPGPSASGEGGDRVRLAGEAASAHAVHRRDLRELRRLLVAKRLVIQRYVRVASPARGTRLASGNLDVFLSALLTVVGWVPALAGNPIYSAFRRAVIEIARNRMDPRLVPGIEAMLPESPMGRLLAQARPRSGIVMAVITGDTDAGDAGLLKRLGVLFTDFLLFDGLENDLVVDTDAMAAGIAPSTGARCRFESGAKVSHFRYFDHHATRRALRDWLTLPDASTSLAFGPLPVSAEAPGTPDFQRRLATVRRQRGGDRSAKPIVVVIPGIMGSHLWINRRERVWFDPAELLLGGLARVRWGTRNVEAEEIFGRYYGDLCAYLADSHRVEPFAYDWRLPLNRLADQFGLFLARLLRASPGRPVRLLAHSMGGLVVRAAIHRRSDLFEAMMGRDGARLVMLGTPHQGSHSMVETLIGKADTIRMLGRLDLMHGLQDVLDIVAGFRGALQLLPRTGFVDAGGTTAIGDFFRRSHWQLLKRGMRDVWFGDGVAGVPDQSALDEARWLWDRDSAELSDVDGRPLPSVWPARYAPREAAFAARTIQVHGKAARTPCGLMRTAERCRMLGTEQGDGSVTWASATIRGIGANYYLPAEHAALTGTEAFFPAIEELLVRGETSRLSTSPPVIRAAAAPVPYDAGPAPYPMPGELDVPLLGIRRARLPRPVRPSLAVSVRAMDLRFVTRPILAGHYEQDPISGAEAIIDAQLVGRRLSERYNLGMYAGPVGTVVVVLQPQNEAERRRGSLHGAVITGLGTLDGTLSETRLTEAVHAGVLRFLMHYGDCIDQPVNDVALSSLLLGYNSSASLGIKAAVAALLNGVSSANQRYLEATRRPLRVASLEIVELYLDTALSTMYALRELLAEREAGQQRIDVDLALEEGLGFGPGWRHRLDDSRGTGYWPRLMVTDADRDEVAADATLSPQAGASTSSGTRVDVARRLRFIQIGQRARAESIIRQRQPGAVETLIERQIASNVYDRDFCRTLFQLMVPHEFKDTARQLQRIVLVLDAYTANLPWELMLTDDKPISIRTQVVRQLVSTRFRTQVRPTRRREAYVIGNTSTAGFFAAFPDSDGAGLSDALAPLPRAEEEARRVLDVLGQNGFEVTGSIGVDCRALDVLNPLYRKEYRIVHIAAHGVVDLRHRDGRPRTGVVLSDGLLITAAEIEAMERVPDLVFLNCCHLARITTAPTAWNRLASSLARELMETGVRCVVAAGWPVDDQAAESFAVTFYESLLAKGLPFGDAVFEARVRSYGEFPASMTWGAYQAYGDPGWQMGADAMTGSPATAFVSPIESAERIERLTIDLNQQGRILGDVEAARMAGEIERILQRGAGPWREHPLVVTALAAAHAQLGPRYFDLARSYYRRAIAIEDQLGQVPIRAIEQLANIEARHGEACDDIGLIESAIRRIEALTVSVEAGPAGDLPANRQRLALLASALKRKAVCHARAAIRGDGMGARRAMRQALARSIDLYESVARAAGSHRPQPYPTVNRLALSAVLGEVPADALPLIDRCIEAATADFARKAGFWDAVVVADAECVRAIISGALARSHSDGDATLERLKLAYRSSLAHVQMHSKRMNTVAGQVAMLAVLLRAEGRRGRVSDNIVRRLQQLAEWLSEMATGTATQGATPSLPGGPVSTATADGASPTTTHQSLPAAPGLASTNVRRNRAGRRPARRRR